MYDVTIPTFREVVTLIGFMAVDFQTRTFFRRRTGRFAPQYPMLEGGGVLGHDGLLGMNAVAD